MGTVLGDNLRALREMKGITQQELAEIACVTRETVNKWESGTIGNIRTANLRSILEHFCLTEDDLRSERQGLAARLPKKTAESASGYATVPLVAADDLECMASLSNLEEQEDSLPRIPVPDILWTNHPHAFALEIDSSSMNRVLPEGCRVIVDPMLTPTSGTIVLARLEPQGENADGDSTPALRRLHLGSSTALLSSETYGAPDKDVVTPSAGLDILGTVVWYQPPEELG